MSYVEVNPPVVPTVNTRFPVLTGVYVCTDCGSLVYGRQFQAAHDRWHAKGLARRALDVVRGGARTAVASFRQGWKDGGVS